MGISIDKNKMAEHDTKVKNGLNGIRRYIKNNITSKNFTRTFATRLSPEDFRFALDILLEQAYNEGYDEAYQKYGM